MLDRQTGQTGRNPVITLSRVLGMFFIVLCHIIKYYSFIPMHESLGFFFKCGVDLFFSFPDTYMVER